MKNALTILGLTLALSAAVAAADITPFVSPSGYRLKPAHGWRLDKSGRLQTDVVLFAPAIEGFAANVSVKIRPRDEDQTLDGDRDAMNTIDQKMFKDYSMVSQETRPLDGVPAVWTVATYHILQPALTLRMYRIEAIKDDKVYYIDAAEQEDCKGRFDAAITSMLGSIHWTSQAEETAARP